MSERIYGHTSRQWNNLIDAAYLIAKDESDVRWAWADLFAKVSPREIHIIGSRKKEERGTVPTVREVLIAFKKAAKLEMSLATMLEYRNTALAWPPNRRVDGATHSAHRALVAHPNRFNILKPGMSFKEASLAAGRDLGHIKKRFERKGGTPTYEDVFGHMRWGNDLWQLAASEVTSLKLTYQQRDRLQEKIDIGYAALDRARIAVANTDNFVEEGRKHLRGNQYAKGHAPANKGQRTAKDARSLRRYAKEDAEKAKRKA